MKEFEHLSFTFTDDIYLRDFVFNLKSVLKIEGRFPPHSGFSNAMSLVFSSSLHVSFNLFLSLSLFLFIVSPPRLSILIVPSFFLVRHACPHTHTHARTHTHILFLLSFSSSLNIALSFQPSLYQLLDLWLCKIYYTRGIEKFSAPPTSQNLIQWPNIKFLVEGPLSRTKYIFKLFPSPLYWS